MLVYVIASDPSSVAVALLLRRVEAKQSQSFGNQRLPRPAFGGPRNDRIINPNPPIINSQSAGFDIRYSTLGIRPAVLPVCLIKDLSWLPRSPRDDPFSGFLRAAQKTTPCAEVTVIKKPFGTRKFTKKLAECSDLWSEMNAIKKQYSF